MKQAKSQADVSRALVTSLSHALRVSPFPVAVLPSVLALQRHGDGVSTCFIFPSLTFC